MPTINDSILDPALDECLKSMWQCCATAYIFQQRSRIYGRRLHFLSFLGIVVPATVGSIVLSFRALDERWLDTILVVAGVAASIQLVLSVLSLANKWDDEYAYAHRSSELNTRLRRKFDQLIKDGTWNKKDRLTFLREQDTDLQVEDEKRGLTGDECRMGMRYSLFQFNKECSACKTAPVSMRPTDCDVCGNFKRRRL